jgi:anti-sigma regulatory factor (Ser/Thr protein kinase)
MEMSLDTPAELFRVEDRSAVGEARRGAAALAARLDWPTDDASRLALIVTEAATNLLEHGSGGQVIVRTVGNGGDREVETLCIDRGRGIPSVAAALRDGYSTAGTAGTGLGAIARLADVFDLHTAVDGGTVLLARVRRRDGRAARQQPHPPRLELGAVCLPRSGEVQSGDAWALAAVDDGALLLVADGLGHGPEAARAAGEAVRVFRQRPHSDPAALLADVHAALKSTRGAAVAAAFMDLRRREIRYAGVGNIAGTIVDGDATRSMVSHNGTLGHEVRKIQEFVYPWPPGSLVVVHSDGLQTHWRLGRYPGVIARHPAVVAGLLYRDFDRGRDDVTVVVARETASSGAPPSDG